MVHFVLLVLCCALYKVKANCPELTLDKNLDCSKYLNDFYELYQYIPVEAQIQSPFYGHTDDFQFSQFGMEASYIHCFYENQTYSQVDSVKFVDDDNASDKLKLVYTNNICGARFHMEDIQLIDCQPNLFISFYGCQVFTINRQPMKFEGVLIYIKREPPVRYNEVSNKTLTSLKTTYQILSQANISETNLIMKLKAQIPICTNMTTLNCPSKTHHLKSTEKEGVTFEKVLYYALVSVVLTIITVIVVRMIKLLMVAKIDAETSNT